MPRSPEPARRQILDAALQLFATNGITGTSLREIRLAANQRNAAALQYHFTDKEGLLRALLERELPLLVDRRRALLSEAHDLWSIAAVFVLSIAYSMILFVTFGALGSPIPIADPLSLVLPSAIYDAVLAAIVGPLAIAVHDRRMNAERVDW